MINFIRSKLFVSPEDKILKTDLHFMTGYFVIFLLTAAVVIWKGNDWLLLFALILGVITAVKCKWLDKRLKSSPNR